MPSPRPWAASWTRPSTQEFGPPRTAEVAGAAGRRVGRDHHLHLRHRDGPSERAGRGGHRPGRLPVVDVAPGGRPSRRSGRSVRVRRQPGLRGRAGRAARRPVPVGELDTASRSTAAGSSCRATRGVLVRCRAGRHHRRARGPREPLHGRLRLARALRRRTGRVGPDDHVGAARARCHHRRAPRRARPAPRWHLASRWNPAGSSPPAFVGLSTRRLAASG